MTPLLFFILSFILSVGLTLLVRYLSLKFKILDFPLSHSRKIHQTPIPLGGGVAIFLTFVICLFISWQCGFWPSHHIELKHLAGMIFAGAILMFGGFLDDRFHLKPVYQIIWPILASLVVIMSGIGIEYINNPFGSGYIYFNQIKIEVFHFKGIPYYFTPLADIFTFIWLMVLAYSTKLLDGLDGLVSGMGVIGSLIIAGLCFLTEFFQLDVGLLALIFSGSILGFLIFNFHPAKIFLGEGGSLLIGFYLGVLSIISGSKVATSFLILGLAVLDIVWVAWRRIAKEHKSPFLGDQEHLHFRLLKAGFSHRQAVIFLWLIAVLWGGLALSFRTKGKLLLIISLILFIFGLNWFIEHRRLDKKGNF
jgi:UDP-GlcNAc:undecaprenyl-phosphate GlcNAc-1-phosphate transferase